MNDRNSCPLPASQMRAVRSFEAVTTRAPSGEEAGVVDARCVPGERQYRSIVGARSLEDVERLRRIAPGLCQHGSHDGHGTGAVARGQAHSRRLRQQQTLRLQCLIALRGRESGLITGRGEAARESCRQHRGRGDAEPVPEHELAHAIDDAVGLSEHDITPQEAGDVLVECIDRCIALGRRLLERLEHDGIEIARQCLRELARGGVARRRHRLVQSGQTRRRRLGLQDGLLERTARIALEPVRAHAGEQLIEDDAQRVDIRGGRDRCAGDLLGGRIVGCERAASELVSSVSCAAEPSVRSFAIPKSSSCASPSSVTRMFEGLRSR